MLCGICRANPDVIKMQGLQSKQIHGIIIHCVTVIHQREGEEFLKPCVELLKSLSSMKVNNYITYVSYKIIHYCYNICISHNMGTRDLPDIYMRHLRVHSAQRQVRICQANPECTCYN